MRARAQLTALMLGGAVMASSFAACDDPADDVAAASVESSAEAPAESRAETPAEATSTESLTFDNERSAIGFEGSKVTGAHEGGFNEFAGTITFDSANVTASQIEVTIQTASLFADDEQLAAHLKNEDFFNVEAIPTATFRSTRIEEGGEGDATHTITGALTLHGKENVISFPATVAVTESEVSARATFSINRMDFDMAYPGRANDLIRERVVIKLDIHAPRG